MCAHTTSQKKHCGYLIHAQSMSIKEGMCRVKELSTLILVRLFASLCLPGFLTIPFSNYVLTN